MAGAFRLETKVFAITTFSNAVVILRGVETCFYKAVGPPSLDLVTLRSTGYL